MNSISQDNGTKEILVDTNASGEKIDIVRLIFIWCARKGGKDVVHMTQTGIYHNLGCFQAY